MGLSFEESLKKANEEKKVMLAMPRTMSVMNIDEVNEEVVAYSGEEELMVMSDKYLYYPEYSDDKISVIDDNKNIALDTRQMNLSQESNSQYIRFEMPRYYDGFDLMNTNLLIHFVNKEGYEDYATPINVFYDSTRIQFAWLIDKRVTAVAGIVKFEIHAVGVNSKGDEYIWKTHPNNKMNVVESLCGNGIIVPDQTWITSFLTQVTEQVAIAQTAAQEAKSAVASIDTYVQEAKDAAQEALGVIDNAKEELSQEVQDAVNTKVEDALSSYYTQDEVDEIVRNIDISDQLEDLQNQIDNMDGLANFDVQYDGKNMVFYNGDAVMKEIEINSNPSAEWTAAYTSGIEEKINEAQNAVQEDLDAYKETTDADLMAIHESIDGLPETLSSDYYTKEAIDNRFATKESFNTVTSAANTNKESISTLSEKIVELNTAVDGIDKSPRLTYEATYDEEYMYTLWEIEGEGDDEKRTPKGQFKIVGGSGGGATSVLKIEYVTKTPLIATINDEIKIAFKFSGVDSSGDAVQEGVATWRVGGTVVATHSVVDGENDFDLTPYIQVGTQKVMLSITDDAGSLVTKSWTVQKIDVRIESTFNDALTYPMGEIAFDYTPYGAIDKTVHFVLDGKEVGTVQTSASGIPMEYRLAQQEHGAHLLDVYMTAKINNNDIESNHICKDIIWYDANSDQPVISCVTKNVHAKQYETTNITYSVYDPTTETPNVVLIEDDKEIATLTLTSVTNVWQYKSSEIGNHVLKIQCGDTIKEIHVEIEKIDINLEPVTAGLVFDFNPSGKSNSDVDKLWNSGDIHMTVSDNFDWIGGGYQIDENGNQYFCIKAGTTAQIDYHLFADDAKRDGKEFKMIFKSTNVGRADATFLTCVDGEDAKIGLEMNVHEAYVHASAGNLYLPYSEEDVIEFEFNINKDTDSIPMVMGYEDGVSTRPMVYTSSHNFTQTNPKVITLGSEYCDLHVYRMKVYNTSLTDRGILNNFIADAGDAQEMIDRYNRNQIYDENMQLTPDILATKCPHLRIIKIEAPHFTNNKSDKVTGTTIQHIYKNGDAVLDNWTAYNSQHSGQGTTSNEYGAAGRNLDLIMNESGVNGLTPYIVLGDGKTQTDVVSLTRTSIPVNYFNVKVNIASSENANNALLAQRYNAYNPYIRPIRLENPNVKDTMEFCNCVIFIKENDPDVTTHREFNDCDWHFYAIGNLGDSKKTDNTRVNDPNDPLECIVEIMDNTFPNSTFPADEEGLANLELDQFDEKMTYGWRYSYNKKDPAVTQPCIEKWKEFYRFVVTSSDEDFKANLKNYFVVDSALFTYLFTTVHTMIDNRAKNTFWHYGKCADGVYRWDLCFDYDNDSALGINNSGELTMTYGYEDTDYKTKGDASTGYAFNAATSTFFCRVRDLFVDELCAMYVDRESAGAWSADGIINQFDAWQSEFPEELWRVDIERKYLRTYRDGNTRFLNQMTNGKKKYQRRQFVRDQEKYMATKFFGNVAVSDQIMFRCNTPTNDNLVIKPDYTLHLTPYADMYLSGLFGATNRFQIRAEAGKNYDIPCPFTTMDDTAVLIYCASQIQSMGDVSACYIHDNDFSKATKLKTLKIGNGTNGYQNTFLTNLGIGANTLLEELDIQNTPNLVQAIDLSKCINLEKLYAHGSGLTGVTFADGGKITIAELPAIQSVTMRDLVYLTDFDIVSYDNMLTMVIENCNTINIKEMIENSGRINRVRILGVDWQLEDTAILEKIYKMAGIDKNGYNVDRSVLTGKVHVPVIRQQQLYDYKAAWSDLEIAFDSMIEQYAVTFINDDEMQSVLDVQYVDKGADAVDPITRAIDPIATPTKESTVSTDYVYAGWDGVLTGIFEPRIIKAVYTERTREYTVKYVSKGYTMQESKGLYGSMIEYQGAIPTYTLEESAYKYNLFSRWDKSGLIDGDKTINAVFDTFEYKTGAFDGKELKDMRPVEIYALTKLGLDKANIEEGDRYSFKLGYDVEYDDIQSEVIVGEKISFNGTNYIDTDIALFDEDRDFVLAIDYEISSASASGSVMAQCFQSNGTNGFKLWNNNGAKLTWGTSTHATSTTNTRELIVIRHKKGDNNLVLYNSNMSGEVRVVTLEKTRNTITNSTLVLGCMKADDGAYENHSVGTVYWCKLWYTDLGEATCKQLVGWVHEDIDIEVSGFKKYYLTSNPTQRASFTFIGSHLLAMRKTWNDHGTNEGGWAEATLNQYLNGRLYNAFPPQMKLLLKQVTVQSSVGKQSKDLSASECYIAIPSVIELSNENEVNVDPYIYEGSTISYMTSDEARKRAFRDGVYSLYWTRSPNIGYSSSYIYQVDDKGKIYGFGTPKSTAGILIEISI